MRSVADGDVSLVLVLMAACSLFSMVGLLQLDNIVHRDLYNFGLHFSYAWAVPYWNLMNFVFAMGWLNIIAAIAFQSYLIIQRRKTVTSLAAEVEEQSPQAEIDRTESVEEQGNQVESQDERGVETPEESETEHKEMKSEAQEESEKIPIIIGVSPEEFQPA